MKKRIKRTTKSLSKEIHKITDGHYSLQSDFVCMNKKVVIKHNDCGNIYEVTPSHFIYKSRRCPICSRLKSDFKRRKNNDQFKKEIANKYGTRYILLGKYTKSNEKVEFKCSICGNNFYVTPNNILKGRGCPYCGKRKANKNETLSNKEFTIRLNKAFGNKILALDDYVKARINIRFKCLTCGYVWSATPDNVLHSRGCPECLRKDRSKRTSKGLNNFRNEVSEITDGEYTVVSSTYINNKTKVKIKHLKCNHTYFVTPHNFLRGKRCPFCKHSSLEENVANCLNSLHISYVEHAHISWLKYDRYQHLDFYIPSMKIAIECDGQQHYKPVDFAGEGMDKAKQLFKDNKLRDKNKDILCKKHGIRIIRIPYTKFPLTLTDLDDFLGG